jgi:hypothetical protein
LQRDDIALHLEEMLQHIAKRGYFIAPRGDASVHALREEILVRQEEMFLRMCKERIPPRGYASAHTQRDDIKLCQSGDGEKIFHCAKMRCICSCAKI